jgi:hypothetical protein
LLDIASFLLNLIALFVLTPLFALLAALAGSGLQIAKAAMGLFCFAIVILQALGAVFKRLAAHQRNPDLRLRALFLYNQAGILPVLLYFFLQLAFVIYGSVLVIEAFNVDITTPGLFGLLLVALPILAAGNTFMVGFYFVSSKRGPLADFFESPKSELIGDGCIFLNVFFNQVLLWYLLADPYFSARQQNFIEFVVHLLAVAAIFLFFYFPPRLFYLAEDFNPKRTGISMILANLPVLLRVLFGVG